MGTMCTQISTGRRHTLTFVPSRGRIYGFGLGCSGQLGNRSSQNYSVPQVVVGKIIIFVTYNLENIHIGSYEQVHGCRRVARPCSQTMIINKAWLFIKYFRVVIIHLFRQLIKMITVDPLTLEFTSELNINFRSSI